MRLSSPRYALCASLQLGFLAADAVFNCVSLFPRGRDGLLVLFIFQDLFLILSMTLMLMMFFSTYLFQAGLAAAALRAGAGWAAAAAAYTAASAALHAAELLAPASALLGPLLALQRCLSPWYYYSGKRAALRVADPRLHDDLPWLPGR